MSIRGRLSVLLDPDLSQEPWPGLKPGPASPLETGSGDRGRHRTSRNTAGLCALRAIRLEGDSIMLMLHSWVAHCCLPHILRRHIYTRDGRQARGKSPGGRGKCGGRAGPVCAILARPRPPQSAPQPCDFPATGPTSAPSAATALRLGGGGSLAVSAPSARRGAGGAGARCCSPSRSASRSASGTAGVRARPPSTASRRSARPPSRPATRPPGSNRPPRPPPPRPAVRAPSAARPAATARRPASAARSTRAGLRCLRAAPSGEPPHHIARRFRPAYRLHFQSRISGRSSPCLAMYCLCSNSLSRIACFA